MARCPGRSREDLNGLILHSFALRMPGDRRTFYRRGNHEQVAEQFSLCRGRDGAAFPAKPLCGTVQSAGRPPAHSPLVERGLSNARPAQIGSLEREAGGDYVTKGLPNAFSWAGGERGGGCGRDHSDEERFVLCGPSQGGRASGNDFIVEELGVDSEENSASRALIEMLAHKRSLLFGLALADRFVNVMLPHARLTLDLARGRALPADVRPGSYILQPLVSLIRAAGDRGPFGRMYTLSFFLIPVDGPGCWARPMSEGEIDQMVNAGWSLALSPRLAAIPQFHLDGPLPGYLSRLSHFPGGRGEALTTLRQAVEAIAFGVALTMARNPGDGRVRRGIGDDVVTSLGSARVSTVVVVDRDLTPKKVEMPMAGDPPGRLRHLMGALATETRTPPWWGNGEQRKYRLDRHFVDDYTYAFGVLPQNRCLIVTSVGCAQEGRRESGLVQAGSVAYMTIGAATAIGTMRAIDRDLEKVKDSEPREIARIEREVAGHLHEIYDLDITREAYRQLYRRLRKRLGITRDYRTLQSKMEALYRATSTHHEVKAQIRLEWLTAAIVVLSVLIFVGTIVVAVKPG
jgi:hypothetical protein